MSLLEDIPTLTVNALGGNVPVQGQGTIDGCIWYFRARGRHWSFEVWGPGVTWNENMTLPDEPPVFARVSEYNYPSGHVKLQRLESLFTENLTEEFRERAQRWVNEFAAGWMELEEATGYLALSARAFLDWRQRGGVSYAYACITCDRSLISYEQPIWNCPVCFPREMEHTERLMDDMYNPEFRRLLMAEVFGAPGDGK